MAVNLTRAVDDAIADIIADPDNQAPGRQSVPADGPELRAFIYYTAKALLRELTEHAELNAATTGTPGVID